MDFWKLYAKFFGIVELEDPYEDRISDKGISRVIKIGFIIGFLLANFLTYFLLGSSGTGFIIPTGLGVNRLVFTVFILHFFYYRFDLETVKEIDKEFGLGIVYRPEIHEDKVEVKH